MDNLALPFAVAGIVGSGISAGVAFVFSNAIMGSLGAAPAEHGMRVMQEINRRVYNAAFMGGFAAATLVCLAATVVGVLNIRQPWGGLMAAGGLLYVLGVFLVTGTRNVPLNTALDRARAGTPEGHAIWRDYLNRWTRWNHARTACALFSALCFAGVVLVR